MMVFWLTFTDGTTGSCEGTDALHAKLIAEKLTGKTVQSGQQLPYPAHPVIWQFDCPVIGVTPAFCRSPEQCAGWGYCRQARACND